MSSLVATTRPNTALKPAPVVLSGFMRGALLAIAGLVVAGYVASAPAARDGLDFLWLVPLTFAFCAAIFAHIIEYHRGGVGLKVLYTIIVVRYLVAPALIVATQGRVSPLMVAASASGYRFSTAATVVELFVCCTTISLAWPRVTRRTAARPRAQATARQDRSTLTIGGVLVVGLLVAIIGMRGLDGVTSSFGFLMLTGKFSGAEVDSYSITAIQVLKSFVCVGVAAACQRNYLVKKNPLWFLGATVLALLNVTTYFGYNRSIIVQTAIASIVTLVYLFPSFRRYIVLAVAPLSGAVVYSLITLKQFGVSAASGQVSDQLSMDRVSQTLETYVNGAWPLATGYDAATAVSAKVDFLTLVRTYTDNFFPFKVPPFTVANDLLNGIPSVLDLYQSHTWPAQGAMLPLSCEMWFYGGPMLGTLLVVAGNALAFYLLVQVEVRVKFAQGAQKKFLYSWMGALFGLTMCYCLVTLWWSFSKFAFFLAIVFWVNNGIVLRHPSEEVTA